ncbi:MAG TPA: bacillithiol biosynthesis cysteine-adding enzyme BshC [Pyrinomonadaceae bacterium]
MEQEIACPGLNGDVVLRAESIPFSQVPGQSRLFLAYQKDPLSLKKYFPSAVASHTQIAERITEVLANFKTDRTALCDALEDTNRQIGSGQKVFEHISLLRESDAVAVVTGQQTGLFTGPLYTIYKALSAVRAAECLRGRGFKAVPVFWAATEDHDFAEVNEAFVLDATGELERIASDLESTGQPVGEITLDAAANDTVGSLFDALRSTEFTPDLRTSITDAWREGSTFSQAFERMLAQLTAEFGLIVIDPLHPTMKRLAVPIYAEAVRKAKEIGDALIARSRELTADEFRPQVEIEKGYFPMFWQTADRTRVALRQTEQGTFRTKDKSREFSADEIVQAIAGEPERFSPGVMLRPVVQDFILPTVCYFGGGGEIAYFAQNSEVYRVLDRPATTILHRQSFTVVEAKHRRTLKRYGLEFEDLFRGFDALLPEIVDRYVNSGLARTFAEVEEKINTELNRLDRELSELDPTLAENLANRRRKIVYHLGAIRGKAQRASLRKDEMVNRQIISLFNELLPRGGMQERTLNVSYFLDQYGPRFIDWIYHAIDLDDNGHRVLYL